MCVHSVCTITYFLPISFVYSFVCSSSCMGRKTPRVATATTACSFVLFSVRYLFSSFLARNGDRLLPGCFWSQHFFSLLSGQVDSNVDPIWIQRNGWSLPSREQSVSVWTALVNVQTGIFVQKRLCSQHYTEKVTYLYYICSIKTNKLFSIISFARQLESFSCLLYIHT
jgi:hypothetical protein